MSFLICFLLALLFGIVLGVAVSLWTLQRFLIRPIADESPPPLFAGTQFQGRHLFSDNEANLSAKAVNAVLQFLFQELKDSGKVRRYFIRKLDEDLHEAMNQKMLGAIIKRIEIQDFSLGQQSPEFTEISLNAADTDSTMSLSNVEVGVHIKYSCGIWLSTAIDLVLDQSARITVRLKKFEADAKLVFRREPFTHWYLSFCTDPEIDVEVSTQLQARNFPQLASLICSQLKKSIGRRHVWPSYSIRFRPFFDSSPIVKRSGQKERELRPFDLLLIHVRSLDRLFEAKKRKQNMCMVGVLVADKSMQTIIEERQMKEGDREVVVPKALYSTVKFSDMILVGNSITYIAQLQPHISACPLREGLIVTAINGLMVQGADHAKHLFEKSSHNVVLTIKGTHLSSSQQQPPQPTNEYSDEDLGEQMARVSYLLPSSDTVQHLRTTKPLKFRRFMEFDECFVLKVRPGIDEYVNVCLLAKDSESSKLMAFTSFTIDEIVRDCDLTLRRECQFSRNLIRVIQRKDEDHELAKHRGYDRMLANGHITTRFQLLERGSELNESKKEDEQWDRVEVHGRLSETFDSNGHQLEARRLAVNTYCAFCNGKIWLKTAYECNRCNIVCHRKCAHLCYTSPCLPQLKPIERAVSSQSLPISSSSSSVFIRAPIDDLALTQYETEEIKSAVRVLRAKLGEEIKGMDDKFFTMVTYTSEHILTGYLGQGTLSVKSTKYVPTAKLPIFGALVGQLTEICQSIESERRSDLIQNELIRLRTQLIQFCAIENALEAMLDMDEVRFTLFKMLGTNELAKTKPIPTSGGGGFRGSSTKPKMDALHSNERSSPGAISSVYKKYRDRILGSWGNRRPIKQSMVDVVSVVYNRAQKAITNEAIIEEDNLFDSVSFRAHHI